MRGYRARFIFVTNYYYYYRSLVYAYVQYVREHAITVIVILDAVGDAFEIVFEYGTCATAPVCIDETRAIRAPKYRHTFNGSPAYGMLIIAKRIPRSPLERNYSYYELVSDHHHRHRHCARARVAPFKVDRRDAVFVFYFSYL